MTTFKKYEFTDQAEWSTFQKKIQVKSTNEEGVDVYSYKDVAVVELGNICIAKDEEGECIDLATTWAVDIFGLEHYYLRSNRLRFIQTLAASIPLLDVSLSI